MKKTHGFTLIELLAVITILAIVALVLIPVVMKIIKDSNKGAFKDSVYGVIKAGEFYYEKNLLKSSESADEVFFSFPEAEGLDLKGTRPTSGSMKINKEGKIELAVTNGKYCATKKLDEEDITITERVKDCIIPIVIKELELEKTSIQMNVQEEYKLDIKIEPSNATNKRLKIASQDESIVKIEDYKIIGMNIGTTKVTIETTDGSKIKREIMVTVKQILTSTNNCINSTAICATGTKVNVMVNDKENHNFFVIKDTGTELELIMDKNIGGPIQWITEEDYIAAGGKKWDVWGFDKGPLTALNALETRTQNWTNVPLITYDIDAPPILTRKNVRAKMVPLSEVESVKKFGTKTGNGYWTLTRYGTRIYFFINNDGNSSYDYGSASYIGVRPIIIIPKNLS